jgi:hypothetical protein
MLWHVTFLFWKEASILVVCFLNVLFSIHRNYRVTNARQDVSTTGFNPHSSFTLEKALPVRSAFLLFRCRSPMQFCQQAHVVLRPLCTHATGGNAFLLLAWWASSSQWRGIMALLLLCGLVFRISSERSYFTSSLCRKHAAFPREKYVSFMSFFIVFWLVISLVIKTYSCWWLRRSLWFPPSFQPCIRSILGREPRLAEATCSPEEACEALFRMRSLSRFLFCFERFQKNPSPHALLSSRFNFSSK